MNKPLPAAIYVLGFTLFAMTTSEYMVAGLITSMSSDLGKVRISGEILLG